MSGNNGKLSRRDVLLRLTGRSVADSAQPGGSGLEPAALMADRLLRQGLYAEAVVAYEACIARNPDHCEAYRNLGFSLLRLKRTAEARLALEHVLGSKSNDSFALLHIGLSHALDGSVAAAMAAWSQYQDYRQVHIQRELNVLLHLHEEGRSPGAAELVERVEEAIISQARSASGLT